MLQELNIENIGVVESASVQFDAGLNVLTGETGAGKTIVLTALGLVLGTKSDPGLVRKGSEKLSVETVWDDISDDAKSFVEESDGTVEDGQLILSRSVTNTGRSKIVCGGRNVPSSVVSELSGKLISIHGQSDHVKLRDVKLQLRVLDKYCGVELSDVFNSFKQKYDEFVKLNRDLVKRIKNNASVEAEKFFTEMVVKDFQQLQPVKGEEGELLQVIQKLTHLEDIYNNLMQALNTAGEGLAGESTVGVSEKINSMVRFVNEVSQYDESIADAAKTLDEVSVSFNDVVSSLQAYTDGVDLDVLNDLNNAHTRLNDLNMMVKKYVPGGNTDELFDFMMEHVEKSNVDMVSVDDLEQLVESAKDEAMQAAMIVSKVRSENIKRLTENVNNELEHLNMRGTKLHINHEVLQDVTPTGCDNVEFMITTASMSAPKQISKAASGGELSRIMLALEVVLADPESVSTFVFDEVDAGVGGATAVEVGKRLAMLAKKCQVIVVTHLPQVAVFADSHFKVSKEDTHDGGIKSSVEKLNDSDVTHELTRMLSGLEGSETGLQHAQELRSIAAGFKNGM
jgi:DNA repair protein RecN (Recombination protein N)